MIKTCRTPGVVSMTLGTIVIKIILYVIRICSSVVIALMATKTVLRQPGYLIVNVTFIALEILVGSNQSESGRLNMIKEGALPLLCGMAKCTFFQKSKYDMIRIGCAQIIIPVTSDTLTRCSNKCLGMAPIAICL